MTNSEKMQLTFYAKEGRTFKEIRELVECVDSTIEKYMKIFGKLKKQRG